MKLFGGQPFLSSVRCHSSEWQFSDRVSSLSVKTEEKGITPGFVIVSLQFTGWRTEERIVHLLYTSHNQDTVEMLKIIPS